GASRIDQPRPLAPRRERRSASHLATAGRIADRAVLAAVPLRGSSPRGGAAAWVEPARQGTSKLDTPGRRHPLPRYRPLAYQIGGMERRVAGPGVTRARCDARRAESPDTGPPHVAQNSADARGEFVDDPFHIPGTDRRRTPGTARRPAHRVVDGAPCEGTWAQARSAPPELVPLVPGSTSLRTRPWQHAARDSCLAARPSGLVGLLEEVAGAVHIDRDTGTHGGGHGDLLDVAALRGGRLQTQDLVERGHVVLDQLLVGERDLADDVVQVRRTVGAELDLAALDVGHGLGGVHRDGAGLGVRHEAAGAEHTTQLAHLAHEVRRGHGRVEIGPAAGDLLDQLVVADLVGPGLAGGVGLR